ncbi:MAG: hypothetical protein IJ861_05150 [Clostridia bacterium]|nr:hypothetical protein [Clostridia bacterium]
MLKKKATELAEHIQKVEQDVENILKTHLEEYSEYGMDDIANELIGIQASLEVVRLRVQYALIKGK